MHFETQLLVCAFTPHRILPVNNIGFSRYLAATRRPHTQFIPACLPTSGAALDERSDLNASSHHANRASVTKIPCRNVSRNIRSSFLPSAGPIDFLKLLGQHIIAYGPAKGFRSDGSSQLEAFSLLGAIYSSISRMPLLDGKAAG